MNMEETKGVQDPQSMDANQQADAENKFAWNNGLSKNFMSDLEVTVSELTSKYGEYFTKLALVVSKNRFKAFISQLPEIISAIAELADGRIFVPICVNELGFQNLDTKLLILFVQDQERKKVSELNSVFSYEAVKVDDSSKGLAKELNKLCSKS